MAHFSVNFIRIQDWIGTMTLKIFISGLWWIMIFCSVSSTSLLYTRNKQFERHSSYSILNQYKSILKMSNTWMLSNKFDVPVRVLTLLEVLEKRRNLLDLLENLLENSSISSIFYFLIFLEILCKFVSSSSFFYQLL